MDGLTDSTDMSLSKPQETAKDRKAWRVHRITKMSDTTERLNNNPEEASSDHSSLSFELDKRLRARGEGSDRDEVVGCHH